MGLIIEAMFGLFIATLLIVATVTLIKFAGKAYKEMDKVDEGAKEIFSDGKTTDTKKGE